jgi:hypothetical protein
MNPLRNYEEMETLGIVLFGVILLITLEPVSTTQVLSAVVLAALVLVFAALDLWRWRHDQP